MMRPTLSDLLRAVHVAGYDETFIARAVKNLGGGRPPFAFTQTVLSQLVTSAETAVCTTPPLSPGLDGALILLVGLFWCNSGAGTAFYTTRIRQGAGVTGTIVGAAPQLSTNAGNAAICTALSIDVPGIVSGIQYSLTGQQSGGAANSTNLQACLLAMAI